jgi:hypothetical protein
MHLKPAKASFKRAAAAAARAQLSYYQIIQQLVEKMYTRVISNASINGDASLKSFSLICSASTTPAGWGSAKYQNSSEYRIVSLKFLSTVISLLIKM